MKKTICVILLLCFSTVLGNTSLTDMVSPSERSDQASKPETGFSVFVSPEMYGAVGDGITDDTAAWQKAVDSGKPVIAGNKKYKCGTLTVSEDSDIDCNNAVFTCTEAVLFSCAGAVLYETFEDDYSKNEDYALSDQFTGIVYLLGTNNVFKQRSGYVGGSIEAFFKGVLDTQIPIDITDVTAYRLHPIQVNIRNIANVVFTSDAVYKIIVKQQYCAFSVIENVNMTNACYSVVQFNQCFKCTYRDSHIEIPQYRNHGDNYYPIAILSSCYTNIENVFAHCVGWHCITTGGNTMCRGTKVTNCELYSDYAIPAYGDHHNGIETTITGSTISSVSLGPLGRLINCDVVCCKEQKLCHVNLYMSSVDGLGHFVIENCRFYPQLAKYAEIRAVCAPRESGIHDNYYLNSLSVVNCTNMSNTVDMPIKQAVSKKVTGETILGVLNVINSNLSVEMDAEEISIFGH